jgi:hypothetical protein
MLHAFLSHLHRGGAYAYYHVLPQRRSEWYEVGDDPPFEPGRARTNLYFSVHPSTCIPPCNAYGEVKPSMWVRSQLRTIAAINCLFAEYDHKDYGDTAAIIAHLEGLCVPEPSVLIASGGGLHVYWLLAEPYALTSEDRLGAAKLIQDRWVGLVGGDPGAKDLCRVLRVPGSWNYKYEPRRPVGWERCELERVYPLVALTAHLPTEKVRVVEPVRWQSDGCISSFNTRNVGAVLEQRGYRWQGRRKMLSPYSSTGQPGVTIDEDSNRAFVHHGSDPLHDGYWKRPFDVVKTLDFGGDFDRALAALRDGRL